MNERIKQLAEQAGIHFHNGGTLDAGSNGIAKFVLYSDMEKFAELIVRECRDIVSEWDMGIDDPIGATDNTSEVARDIVAEIKEHFGVEE